MSEARLRTFMLILVTALFISVLVIAAVQGVQTAISERNAAAVHWEDFLCPACGGMSYLEVDIETGIAVNRCLECGLEEAIYE